MQFVRYNLEIMGQSGDLLVAPCRAILVWIPVNDVDGIHYIKWKTWPHRVPLFSTSLTQSCTIVGSFVLCALTSVVKSTPKTNEEQYFNLMSFFKWSKQYQTMQSSQVSKNLQKNALPLKWCIHACFYYGYYIIAFQHIGFFAKKREN